jgi:hypothetical protein
MEALLVAGTGSNPDAVRNAGAFARRARLVDGKPEPI